MSDMRQTSFDFGAESLAASSDSERPALSEPLMEEVCKRDNLLQALQRVKSNKGSAGIDGMSVDELPTYLKQHWLTIRDQLLSGTYKPQPVKRVEIPKPGGGMRKLGIPCVLDRFIQQAVWQVRQPRWDPTFSPHSFGPSSQPISSPSSSAGPEVCGCWLLVCRRYRSREVLRYDLARAC